MEACSAFVWTAWLAVVTLQATFCRSFVLPLQTTTTRAKHKPGRYYGPAAAPRNLYLRSQPPAQRTTSQAAAVGAVAAPLRLPNTLVTPLPRRCIRVSSVLPLSATPENDVRSGSSDDRRGYGTQPRDSRSNSSSSSSSRGGDAATNDEAPAAVVQAETRRLMSVPTIDIKLELQMRGVEHRDAFEKVDLARRLAEARVSCPSPPAAAPSVPGDENDAAADRPWTKGPVDGTEGQTAPAGNRAGEDGPVENEERGGAAESAVYARDVAKATRMGKAAVSRELNGMGIAHSRLSDVSVLARLYADGRREAREDAKEARRFPRAVRSAANDSEEREGAEARAHGGEEPEGSGREGRSGDNGEQRRSARDQLGRVTSGLPWNGGEKIEDEDNEDEGHGWGAAMKGAGENVLWNEGRGEHGDSDDDGDSAEGGRSVRANARYVTPSSGGDGGGGIGDGRRGREASLHARADRMSSRELMKALDDLGAQYRIPAPRLELQEAFVSAVLAEDGRSQGGLGARGGGDRAEIVPVSPYAATPGEEDGLDGDAAKKRSGAGFGTYHAALRWARQLNFDDVLEELRYRGVAHNARADYSHLTRLLADEVLADEELMEAEGVEGVYTAELELAMAMSAQDIIRDLRAGGERVDVTQSKGTLAEKLAEMNMRLHAECPPESGSSAPFYRQQRRPKARERAGAGASTADSLGRGGDGDTADVLLELEEAAKSVGGAALLVAKETAAFVSQTAAGLFPNAFPDEGEDGGVGNGSASAREHRRRRMRPAGGGRGVVGDGGQGRGARAVRERAGEVGKAATGFAQSSVNRAGFAVAQSVANGALKGAEAAADWAGDGALAREYVLLFVAAFCLVFKRGVGAAVALLVVIRFGRSTAQKLVSEGWKVEQQKRARAREGGGVAATAGGGDAASYRRDNPQVRYPVGAAADGRPRRRKAAGAAKAEERRRPRVKKNARKTKRNPAKSRRPKKAARKPLWDSESEDDGRGCVVM